METSSIQSVGASLLSEQYRAPEFHIVIMGDCVYYFLYACLNVNLLLICAYFS